MGSPDSVPVSRLVSFARIIYPYFLADVVLRDRGDTLEVTQEVLAGIGKTDRVLDSSPLMKSILCSLPLSSEPCLSTGSTLVLRSPELSELVLQRETQFLCFLSI